MMSGWSLSCSGGSLDRRSSSESLRNPGTGQSVRRRVSGPEEVNQERRRVSRPKEVNQEILESLGWSYLSDSAWLLGSAFW